MNIYIYIERERESVCVCEGSVSYILDVLFISCATIGNGIVIVFYS